MDQTLQEFVDTLIEERGLSDMDAGALDELRADIYSQAEEAVVAAMESALDDEGLRELEALRDEGDEEAVSSFLERSVPGYAELLEAELERFKDSYQI